MLTGKQAKVHPLPTPTNSRAPKCPKREPSVPNNSAVCAKIGQWAGPFRRLLTALSNCIPLLNPTALRDQQKRPLAEDPDTNRKEAEVGFAFHPR